MKKYHINILKAVIVLILIIVTSFARVYDLNVNMVHGMLN